MMESISSVTSCGKLIMYYTSFVAEEQELFWPARAISGIQFFSPQARRQAQVSELEEEEICCVMESISSVTSFGKLIMYYTSFVAEEQELFWPARAMSGIQFFSPQADCPFFKHIYIC